MEFADARDREPWLAVIEFPAILVVNFVVLNDEA
jgi:hypothetical protein